MPKQTDFERWYEKNEDRYPHKYSPFEMARAAYKAGKRAGRKSTKAIKSNYNYSKGCL